jgi:hypothetical protein
LGVIEADHIARIGIRDGVRVDGTSVDDVSAIALLTVLDAEISIFGAGSSTILDAGVRSGNWQQKAIQCTSIGGFSVTP